MILMLFGCYCHQENREDIILSPSCCLVTHQVFGGNKDILMLSVDWISPSKIINTQFLIIQAQRRCHIPQVWHHRHHIFPHRLTSLSYIAVLLFTQDRLLTTLWLGTLQKDR